MRMQTETMQNNLMAMMYNILCAVYGGKKTPSIEKQGTIIRFFRTIFIFVWTEPTRKYIDFEFVVKQRRKIFSCIVRKSPSDMRFICDKTKNP